MAEEKSKKDKKKLKAEKPAGAVALADASALAEAIANFSIEDPVLPEAIGSHAFASGVFPYTEKMKTEVYEAELQPLQIELLKLQDYIQKEGQRLVIVFEGRDAAGKGGAIQRVTEHLNPRTARVVALTKPSTVEAGQWYFQRYIQHLPTKGEIVIFDRSWYNRAAVEPVLGFCTPEESERLLSEVPDFESMLVRDGIRLVKIFLTVGQAMQLKRLHARYHDPLKRWKLSPVDFQSLSKWKAYSEAFDKMLDRTDTLDAPWTVIEANDKLRTRLAVMRHILGNIPYPDKNHELVGAQDRSIALTADEFLAQGGEE